MNNRQTRKLLRRAAGIDRQGRARHDRVVRAIAKTVDRAIRSRSHVTA